MAKRTRSKNLESRAARSKLKPRPKPYFESIGPRLHVGYRRGKDARKWVARVYTGTGKYYVETLGDADDIADADGVNVLDFWQATSQAREVARLHIADRGDGAEPAGPYTVGAAIQDYIEHMAGRPTGRGVEQSFAAYVPDSLASVPVVTLTRKQLEAWHRSIVKTPPRRRTGKGIDQQHMAVDLDDPETARRRKVTANRNLANLKAALNLAFKDEKVPTDSAWRHVRLFQQVNEPRTRHLTVAECQRLLNACEPDFRKLVRACLETGMRYQEAARLRCSDFNPDSGTVLIRTSKTGRSRQIALTEEGADFFTQMTMGRAGDQLIMGKEWSKSMQERPMAAACARAKITPPVSIHALRHTWASLAVMGGTPLMVVAKNLGHSSTQMVEKHYGHLREDYIAAEIRKGAPRFGATESNVRHLHK